MDDSFKIYIDRLLKKGPEKINELFSPEFLDVHESDLSFHTSVSVRGEASIVEKNLILQLSIRTEATMPCAICSKPVQVELLIPRFCHTEEVENIHANVFNYSELLREVILLEVPHVAECCSGKCPERKNLEKYFAKTNAKGKSPFADL